MLNLLVLVITILIVYLSVRMYYDSSKAEVDYVISERDNQKYLVRNLPDKERAAQLLSLIKERMIVLVEYLKNKYPTDHRVKRLVEKFDANQISEGSPYSLYTSYSVNKGEKIVFCIRQRDDHENLLT